MKKHRMLFAAMLLPGAVFATPLLTITPSLLSTVLRSDSEAVVQYTVTNNTSATLNQFSVSPNLSVGTATVPSASDNCSSLAAGASCTFNLVVSGAGISNDFTLNPSVCVKNGALCAHPTSANRTSVTVQSVSASNTRAYIPAGIDGGDEIQPIKVSNNAFETAVGTFAFQSVAGVALSADGTRLYVGERGVSPRRVLVFNTTTSPISLVSAVSVGAVPVPGGLAVSPDGGYVYVAGNNNGTLLFLNTATNAIQYTVSVGSSPLGVAVSPDGSYVYLANASGAAKVNATTRAVSYITGDSFSNPVGIAVSPDGTRVYVTNADGDSVTVINAATDAIITNVSVGNSPEGVAVSPDGSKVYVANMLDNTVSVINANTNTVSDTISLTGASNSYPYGIAVSPDGSKVFVTKNNASSMSVITTADDSVTALSLGQASVALGEFIG